MKSFFLLLPSGTYIDIVENPLLEKPFAGADGILSLWQFYDQKTKKAYVGNIYQIAFGLAKWDISKGADMCVSIAKKHLNDLIDNMYRP